MKKTLLFLVVIFVCIFNCTFAISEEKTYISGDYKYKVLEDGTIKIVKGSTTFNNTYKIPAMIDDFHVTVIGPRAFDLAFAYKIIIPEGVLNIENGAFGGSVRDLSIPSTVIKMDIPVIISPFDTSYLEKISVNSKNPVYSVANNCLINKEEKQLIFYPFAATAKSLTTPKGIESIAQYAFYYNKKLTSLTISEGVISANLLSFRNCEKLKKITIPKTLTDLRLGNFSNGFNELEEIIVHKDNPVFGSFNGILYNKIDGALIFCPPKNKAKKIDIPENIKTILPYAFNNNQNLKSLHISGSVEYIQAYAITNCRVLADLTIDEGVKLRSNDSVHDCPHLITVNYPNSAAITTIDEDNVALDLEVFP